MKKLLVLIISIFAICQLFAQELTVDEILSKNLKAIGQDKLMNAQTIKLEGKMTQQGIDIQITQYQKKPDKIRMDMEVQGMNVIMAIDGETGWSINPMMGSTEAVDLPAETIASLEKEGRSDPTASWDNPFVTWKENGTTVELVGKEDINGSSAYNLKFTYKDNDVVNYFVDTDSFFLLKTKSTEAVQGQTFEREIKFSEYRETEGILFPVKIEILINGQVQQVFTMDKCEFDMPIDDSIFKKPVPAMN